MARIYRQKITAILINGYQLQCLADGSPYRMQPVGGETSITEGTDGGGINIGTAQGHIIEVDLREDSDDHGFLMDIHRNQSGGGPGVPLVMYTGTDYIFSTDEAYVSAPGPLATGGAKQGSRTYKFVTNKADIY